MLHPYLGVWLDLAAGTYRHGLEATTAAVVWGAHASTCFIRALVKLGFCLELRVTSQKPPALFSYVSSHLCLVPLGASQVSNNERGPACILQLCEPPEGRARLKTGNLLLARGSWEEATNCTRRPLSAAGWRPVDLFPGFPVCHPAHTSFRAAPVEQSVSQLGKLGG